MSSNFVFSSAAIHQYLDGTDLFNLIPATQLDDKTNTDMTQRVGLQTRLTLGIQVPVATNAKWGSDYDVTARA